MSTPREIRDARRLAGAQFRPFDWDDAEEDKHEPDEDDIGICPTCNGSGEGMYDGSTCSDCGGWGER